MGSITELLQRIERGDDVAREELFAEIYPRLKEIAHQKLGGVNRDLLQTTAVVNEACARMSTKGGNVTPRNRAELFAAANRAIQWVLVDYARKSLSSKRTVDRDQLIHELVNKYEQSARASYIDLHEAMADLRSSHQRVADVVEARFFGGLTMQEAAEICEISLDTAKRDWKFGRAFLHARLS